MVGEESESVPAEEEEESTCSIPRRRNVRNLENVTCEGGILLAKAERSRAKNNITGIFFMCGKIHVFDNDVVN